MMRLQVLSDLHLGVQGMEHPRTDADVVVLASYWQPWQVPWLKDSVGRLQGITQGRVLLLGPKSFGRPDVNQLLALTAAERQAWRQPPDGITHQTHKAIEALGIDGFVDVQTMVCEGGQACPAVGPTGHLLSEDGVHLTRAGAVWLGERLRGSALTIERIVAIVDCGLVLPLLGFSGSR